MHACKLLNGFGGGYITTNDSNFAKRLALLRGFGFGGIDNVVFPGGMNAKLNEIHAAMALASLDDVDDQIMRNRERYYTYKCLLATVPGVRLLDFDENNQTGYKNIVVEILDDWPFTRAETIEILNYENILVRAYYAPPLHQKHMAFAHMPANLPTTDKLAEKYLNLPCGHLVTIDDITSIVNILEFITKNAINIRDRLAVQNEK